ncbi:MAG: type VI secretion system baseplate subunit TssK [Paracoccaceae bacterium]
MAEDNRVVWSEGLFLRSQHFQQQDRHTEGLIRGALRAAPLQAWGFSRIELDRAALDTGQVSVLAAEGLFPDGTPFAIPSQMPAPPALPVKAGSGGGVVALAIPASPPGAAAIDPAHGEPSGARYRGVMAAVKDTVRGGAEAEEIEIAQLSARLFAPGEDAGGYVILPVARIDGLKADGGVALAEGYLPPALGIGAVPWYGMLLQEIVTGLDRIAEAHGGQILAGAGKSVENLLVLDVANGARPRMAHFLAQNLHHPSELFLELLGLAGRLATYGASSRRLGELPAYDHGDPQPAFLALADALRSFILSLRHVEPKSRALPVARHAQNVWKVRIDNPDLLRTARIVVRVGSNMSDESLRRIFVSQATVGAADAFEKLWKSRLPGIPLKPLNSQPREIPYDGDRLCLELDQKSEHWAQLLDAPGFVMGVSGVLETEPQIDVYAVSR